MRREVVEMALAHRLGDKAEQAYARADSFAKRRALMDAWAAYCASLELRKVETTSVLDKPQAH